MSDERSELELFRAVSEKTRTWGTIDGVIGVGLGYDDQAQCYAVRVLTSKPHYEIAYLFPKTLSLSLSTLEELALPVYFEHIALPAEAASAIPVG